MHHLNHIVSLKFNSQLAHYQKLIPGTITPFHVENEREKQRASEVKVGERNREYSNFIHLNIHQSNGCKSQSNLTPNSIKFISFDQTLIRVNVSFRKWLNNWLSVHTNGTYAISEWCSAHSHLECKKKSSHLMCRSRLKWSSKFNCSLIGVIFSFVAIIALYRGNMSPGSKAKKKCREIRYDCWKKSNSFEEKKFNSWSFSTLSMFMMNNFLQNHYAWTDWLPHRTELCLHSVQLSFWRYANEMIGRNLQMNCCNM